MDCPLMALQGQSCPVPMECCVEEAPSRPLGEEAVVEAGGPQVMAPMIVAAPHEPASLTLVPTHRVAIPLPTGPPLYTLHSSLLN